MPQQLSRLRRLESPRAIRNGRPFPCDSYYEQEIEDIALGAAVLGTGGGGDPYVGKLMAREAVRQYGPVELYTLDELDDDDLIVPSAGMGAPIVIVEKLPAGDDMIRAFEALGRYSGRECRVAR